MDGWIHNGQTYDTWAMFCHNYAKKKYHNLVNCDRPGTLRLMWQVSQKLYALFLLSMHLNMVAVIHKFYQCKIQFVRTSYASFSKNFNLLKLELIKTLRLRKPGSNMGFCI